LFRILDNFIKHSTAIKNKIHEEAVLGVVSKFAYRSSRRHRKHYDIKIKAIEAKIRSPVKKDQYQKPTLLISVPGISKKTALFLIIVTDGFFNLKTALHQP
jgi:transposase